MIMKNGTLPSNLCSVWTFGAIVIGLAWRIPVLQFNLFARCCVAATLLFGFPVFRSEHGDFPLCLDRTDGNFLMSVKKFW